MRKINEELAPNESLVFTGIPDWTFLLRYLWGAFFGVVAFVAIAVVEPAYWWVGAVILVLTIPPLVFAEVRRRSNHFVLTTERLRDVEGVIARHAVDIPLDRIMNISHKQSLLGRLINSGTLYIESAGLTGKLEAEHTAEPSKLQALINRQVEVYNPHGPSDPVSFESVESGEKRKHRNKKATQRKPRGQSRPSNRPHPEKRATPTYVKQSLRDLAQLHEQQVLTDDEFDQKKRLLLERG